jgi:hypothetical protein
LKIKPRFAVVCLAVCCETESLFRLVEPPFEVELLKFFPDTGLASEPLPFEVDFLKVSPEIEIVSEPSLAEERLMVVLMVSLKLFALDDEGDVDDDDDDDDVSLDGFALEVVSFLGL